MPRIEFTVESSVPPERVIAAAADFTDRRPDLWPNISRGYYEVHQRGDSWAVATEGSDVMGGIWARERYDWSTPGVIRATVLDSNIFASGIWELRAEPNGQGGSRIHLINDRKPKGKGKIAAVMMWLTGKKLLTGHLQKTLTILENEPSQTMEPRRSRGGRFERCLHPVGSGIVAIQDERQVGLGMADREDRSRRVTDGHLRNTGGGNSSST